MRTLIVVVLGIVCSVAPGQAIQTRVAAATYSYMESPAWKKLQATAEKGDAHAQREIGVQYLIGLVVGKNDVEALKWLRKAADQNDIAAQSTLGSYYFDPSTYGGSMERNYAESFKWNRRAAEQGAANSQYNLAMHYALGLVVEKDYTQAAKWYRKAADQGDAAGQVSLGRCYEFGEGVEKDPVEAYAWYNLAGKSHDGFAKIRDKLERRMSSQEITDGQNRTRELRKMIEKNMSGVSK